MIADKKKVSKTSKTAKLPSKSSAWKQAINRSKTNWASKAAVNRSRTGRATQNKVG